MPQCAGPSRTPSLLESRSGRTSAWAAGPLPARAYIDALLPDVLDGRIDPGRVFDRVTDLEGVPDGYRAMNDREVIKVMIEF